MSAATFSAALGLAAGSVLVCALMALWRRQVSSMVAILRLQGVALGLVAGVLAAHEHDAGLAVTAALVLVVKAVVVPALLGRALSSDPRRRESAPLINVPASLVAGAVLIVVAFAVSGRIIELAPSVTTRLAPLGIATILVGYLVLVTRRRAVSQIVGLLLVDNGIALVTFLLTSGVPLIVELGSSLDVLLVVVVLRVVFVNATQRLGSFELDEMTELRD